MKRVRQFGAILLAAMVSPSCAQNSIFTVSQLALVGQKSFADDRSIILVSEDPFSSATASDAKNYAVEPMRKIESVQWDPLLSSVVYLKLDKSTPLKAGETYEASVLGGENAAGKKFDAYYMRKKFVARSAETERQNILNCVVPGTGAITIKHHTDIWKPTDGVRITPYFACMAVSGLTGYARLKGEYAEKDLAVADAYLDWHKKHMDVQTGYINDYHGPLKDIRNTNDFDSTDSYGAYFVISVWRQFALTNDLKKLNDRWDAVKLAVKAIRSTQDAQDYLTLAKPSYPVKYAMDNVEVWQGFLIAAQVARTLGKTEEYKEWSDLAAKVEASVKKELWWNRKGPWRYSVGKDNGGKLFGDWDKYYPDGMANDMTMDMMHFPGEERMKQAWDATRAKYLSAAVPDPNVELHAVRVAMRMNDKFARDFAWMNTLRLHEESYYSFMSGQLLDMLWWEREEALRLTSRPSDDKINWDKQPMLVFHPAGMRSPCFDNRYTALTDTDSVAAGSLYRLRFASAGTKLRLQMEAFDSRVCLADGREGIASLQLCDAATGAQINASAFLEDSWKVKCSAGSAQVRKTDSGYVMEWDLPLDRFPESKAKSLGFNLVVSDDSGSGKIQQTALDEPQKEGKPLRSVLTIQ